MLHRLRLFVAVGLLDAFINHLTEVLGPDRVAVNPSHGTLPSQDLSCLVLTYEGQLTRLRTPYVHPLLDPRFSNEFSRQDFRLDMVPGVDWVLLGGDARGPALRAKWHMEAHGLDGVEVSSFRHVSGALPREPRPGEPRLVMRRYRANYNEDLWGKRKSELLALDESRWPSLKMANTTDAPHLYLPFLDGRVKKPPRLILDLGCGLGQVTRTLALRYPQARVVGLDASANAIEVARAKFRLPNLEFRVFDISEPLDFPDGSVDVIMTFNALMYANNQLATARDIFRVLSPEGLLANHCRLLASHQFWDFPRSALIPTVNQLQVDEWRHCGVERGFGTEVLPPMGFAGFSPAYFVSGRFVPFVERLKALRARMTAHPESFATYQAYMSHALMVHQRGPSVDRPRSDPAVDYLAKAEMALAGVASFPVEAKEAAIYSWAREYIALALAPEALEYLCACLPAAAPVLRVVLGGIQERRAA